MRNVWPHAHPVAIYRRDDGLVIIDPVKCTGCMSCLDVCPYGAIYFNRDMNLAQKCTGCAHLLDRGWKEPRCVDVCPTGAIRFGEEEELKSLIEGADVLFPEEKARPLVHYRNLPKRFIAGSIFDAEEDECLEDVKLTLTSVATPARRQTAGMRLLLSEVTTADSRRRVSRSYRRRTPSGISGLIRSTPPSMS